MDNEAQAEPTAEEIRAKLNAEFVPPYELGATVYLKSGSPGMTVEYINPPGDPGGVFIATAWTDGDDRIVRSQFPATSLVGTDPWKVGS